MNKNARFRHLLQMQTFQLEVLVTLPLKGQSDHFFLLSLRLNVQCELTNPEQKIQKNLNSIVIKQYTTLK